MDGDCNSRLFEKGDYSNYDIFSMKDIYSPTHCLGETPFETVSGRISPRWAKWGKHSQIEHGCGIFSTILEK
jgi:hypothetical protein